jgi:HD-GYP domain-containing protein (c-di-GMP phosphodiesterase class II)
VTPVRIQPGLPILPERLQQRMASLGVTCGLLRHDGRLSLPPSARPLEQLIAQAPTFTAAARQAWPALLDSNGAPALLWPGLWLLALPAERRRRPGAAREQVLIVALLLGSELLASEQLQRVLDQNGADRQAVLARVDAAALLSDREVGRLSSLLHWMRQDALEIDHRFSELHTLSQELAESYEELSLLYKFSTNMTVNQHPRQFLSEACRELQQVMGFKWMALQVSEADPHLKDLAGGVILAGQVDADEAALRRMGLELLRHHPGRSAPVVIEDTRTLPIPGLHSLSHDLLVVTLASDDNALGVLFGGDKLDASPISSIDSKLCNSLAGSLSIFLDNLMLYEDMQAMFMGTLHALTNSIDAKDSYTHGHSERVALMSKLLAEAAGLDEQTVERVYIAGLVHDVGKIGVPENVLCKPGPLTREEFNLIKMHPEIGARIIQDIPQMQDLVPGVLYHHERWDGKGYPHQLKGEEIPLFGRVIGLADAFDAMSSNRAYRHSLTHEQVLAEVLRCAGKQFDPTLAEHFVKLDFGLFRDAIRRHQEDEERHGGRQGKGVGS